MVERALAGNSPAAGDRRHFHHLLLERTRPRTALCVYLLFLVLPGALAEISEAWGKFGLLVCAPLYAAIVLGLPAVSRRAVQSSAAMNASPTGFLGVTPGD
jgi:hypothetical protein